MPRSQPRERGDRPARRDHHPADRVRLGARDGPADRDRAVRHRHRHRHRAELAHRCIDMPDFTTAGGGDDRHRRRHRLRAVHRHALPRGPRTTGSSPNDAVVRAHRHGRRAVLFAGITVMISLLGLFLMSLAFMRGLAIGAVARVLIDDARVDHAAARRCSASSAATSTSFASAPPQAARARQRAAAFWYRWSRVIQRHPWPAADRRPARPARARDPGALDAPRLRRRRQPTRRPTPPARPTTSLADGFGPGFNGPLLLATETPERPADIDGARPAVATTLERHRGRRVRHRRRSRTPRATRRCIQVFPDDRPAGRGDRATSSSACATT